MRRLAIAALSVLVLGLWSVAFAAGSLSGTYKTKIHTTALHGVVNGTWTISFKRGAYTVTDNGTAVIHGKYVIKASKITLRDKSGKDACSAPGTYTYKLTGSALKFTRVSDGNAGCSGRVVVLGGKFTKIG